MVVHKSTGVIGNERLRLPDMLLQCPQLIFFKPFSLEKLDDSWLHSVDKQNVKNIIKMSVLLEFSVLEILHFVKVPSVY